MKENKCELRLINNGTEIQGNAKNKDTEITSWVSFADEYEEYLGGCYIRGHRAGSAFPPCSVQSPHPKKLAELIDSVYQYLFKDDDS